MVALVHVSVDGDGFEVLNPKVKLQGVAGCGFVSNVVHRILKVGSLCDHLPLLVRDGEVDVLLHAANVWRRVSMVWEMETSPRRESMKP